MKSPMSPLADKLIKSQVITPTENTQENLSSAAIRQSFTPGSARKSANADANSFSDIERLTKKAEAGEGFQIDNENIYATIARILIDNQCYHSRAINSAGRRQVPKEFSSVMQTTWQEDVEKRFFAFKRDGTAYKHGKKAAGIIIRLINLYKKISDNVILIGPKDREIIADYAQINSLHEQVREAKRCIVAWLNIWHPMAIDSLEVDLSDEVCKIVSNHHPGKRKMEREYEREKRTCSRSKAAPK